MAKVAVIGAGINGICSAYQIKDAFPNFDVTVIAEKFTPNNTSDGAAGYWRSPKMGGTPIELVNKWAQGTQRFILEQLKTADAPLMGLGQANGYLLSCKELTTAEWRQQSPTCHILTESELKRFPPKIKSGCSYTSVIIEGAKFIPYLSKQFLSKGGKFIKKKIYDIDSLFETYDLVINCCGLAAQTLVNDDQVYPVRGQVIRVKAPWIKEFTYLIDVDEDGRVVYIFPNQDYIVIGGTKQKGNSDLEVNLEERDWIMERTQEFVPSLKHAEFVCDWVGLRPGRTSIRLEKEIKSVRGNDGVIKKGIIIHNYGQEGNGMTLSWGCCEEVVELVRECCKNKELNLHSKL